MISMILFLLLNSTSAEFQTERSKLPNPVNQMWNSIFRFDGHLGNGTAETGTASYIGESLDKYYFITAHHVVSGACKKNGPCQKPTFLSANDKSHPLELKNASIERVDKGTDVAIFSIKKTGQVSLSHLKPLTPPQNCDVKQNENSFIIGYPAYHLRYGGKNSNLKRWSPGNVSVLKEPLHDETGNQLGIMTQITNEALPGNSGGPTLNSRGELVGVVSASDVESKPNQRKYSTLITPCQVVNNLISSLKDLDKGLRVNIASKDIPAQGKERPQTSITAGSDADDKESDLFHITDTQQSAL